MKFVVEGRGGYASSVADSIRRFYPVAVEEASEGYGRILVLEPGKPPFTLCSFLLDLEPEDVLTLFWVKLKEFYPEALQPGRRGSP
ncbi:MAG TPA: hypothetical protein VMS77_04945 [Conexivisphaerales archaeon]|nr:hypothetical protein [Conexivisphaerales archaeon]